VGEFEQLSSRLESIANLEDLKAIRQSLSKSATGMKCRVDDMARDSRQAICSSTRNWAFTRRGWRRWNGSPSDREFLSGPDNRQYVEHQLAFVSCAQAFCLILFDLNNFKLVSDSWGHLAGDELLKQFAHELKSFFRPIETVGRWGGDEFIAVMDCGLNEAMRHIENLPKWLFGDYKITVGGATRKMHVRASFGLAAWQERKRRSKWWAGRCRHVWSKKQFAEGRGLLISVSAKAQSPRSRGARQSGGSRLNGQLHH